MASRDVVDIDVGTLGVITDVDSYKLPPEAWSHAINVRFEHGKAKKFDGYASVFHPPSTDPYFALPVSSVTNAFWIYAGAAKVYVTDGTGHFNITRQTTGVDVDYSMDADLRWNGVVFNGVPVLNNGIDVPQAWSPLATGTRLVDLPNWPSTLRARIMRAFGQNLIAMDITDSGTRFPRTLQWSHTADPGALPSSWDPTDLTLDADRVELGKTDGFILDGVPMDRVFIIYKQDSCHLMQFVGGQTFFRIDPILPGLGLLAPYCACEFDGKHLMITPDDIVVHNARDSRSIIDGRRRRALATALIDATYKQRTFVVANKARSEVWMCYPSPGQTYPNTALVWNWITGALTTRELPNQTTHAALGIVAPAAASNTFDAATSTFDAATGIFDARSFDPSNTSMLATCLNSDVGAALMHMDQGRLGNTTVEGSHLERTGISIFGRDWKGNPKTSVDNVKLVTRVIPYMTASRAVRISVGMQDRINGPIRWQGPFDFDPNTQTEIPVHLTGKLPAIKFESNKEVEWELQGYGLDIKVVGR